MSGYTENKSGIFLIGESRAINRVRYAIDKVKDQLSPVFIEGESGTGKELAAKEIHYRGVRTAGKFVALNCGAIPDHLLESELFGYSRGAFTGAFRDKPGLVEEASGGTLFLDEIGDLSFPLQAKLLRVIQERELRRVGEIRIRRVDARFVSATNKNIEIEVKEGRFRVDLYYRLKIISICMPPLRERRQDISLLIDHFFLFYGFRMNRTKFELSDQARELLNNYSWPGNVRELQNEVEKCLVMVFPNTLITDKDLSPHIRNGAKISFPSDFDFIRAKADFERKFLSRALSCCHYNRARTAEKLGISRQGLFKLIKKHQIEIPNKGESRELV
jgi:two-component system response regulator AtoC